MINFEQLIVSPLDGDAMRAAEERLDALSKPLGSLGALEEYAVKLAGIRGIVGGKLSPRAVLVFSADNGVHAEQITPVPQAVTALQSAAIAAGGAGVSVLAKQAHAQVFVYDVGINTRNTVSGVIDRRVMDGTQDIAAGPAMSRDQCLQAIKVGYDAVAERKNAQMLGIGEMGICNTATASAVSSVLLHLSPEDTTGRGAGITNEQYEKKVSVIRRAIEINRPDAAHPIDVIAKVGGLDIAAMTGAYLACAAERIPVIIDGYISACAALCAYRMNSGNANYFFASHKSEEIGQTYILRELGLKPALNLNMRLGEGSGCPLMFTILDASMLIIDDMATLAQGSIDGTGFVDLRET